MNGGFSMKTKTSVDVVRNLNEVDKRRRYFHDTNSDVLCEIIKHGTITAIRCNSREIEDVSDSLEAIIVDDGLTRLTLIAESNLIPTDNLNAGDVIRVNVESKRYANNKGYMIVVDGEVAENGLSRLIAL